MKLFLQVYHQLLIAFLQNFSRVFLDSINRLHTYLYSKTVSFKFECIYNLNKGLLCQQYGVSLINMSPDASFLTKSAGFWLTFILVIRSKLYQIDNKNSIVSHPITTTYLHPLNTKTEKDKFLTLPLHFIIALSHNAPALIVFTPPYILSLLCHIKDPHDCFHTPLTYYHCSVI